MSETGEGALPPPTESKYTFEGSFGRSMKLLGLEQKAYEYSWPKAITGRRVDFPQPDGKLIWGVEMEIPLRFESVRGIYEELFNKLATDGGIQIAEREIQKRAKERENRTWFTDLEKFGIPDRIKSIRILDLAPQELLPKKIRDVDSKRNWVHDLAGYRDSMERLADQSADSRIVDRAMRVLGMGSRMTQQRSEALHDLLFDLFGDDKERIGRFKEIIERTGGNEILIVHAHGGYDNMIGEQTGNWVDLAQVVEKYDQPDKYGAILINTCYLGNEPPPVKRVPVFRAKGKTNSQGGVYGYNWNKLLVSEPSK
jgi:hypothetical protein